mgnify:CR=1 FL=1
MKPISLLALALVTLFVISPQSIAQSSGRRLQSPNNRNRNIATIVRELKNHEPPAPAQPVTPAGPKAESEIDTVLEGEVASVA